MGKGKAIYTLNYKDNSKEAKVNFNTAYRYVTFMRKQASEPDTFHFTFKVSLVDAANKKTVVKKCYITKDKATRRTFCFEQGTNNPLTWAEVIRTMAPTEENSVNLHVETFFN